MNTKLITILYVFPAVYCLIYDFREWLKYGLPNDWPIHVLAAFFPVINICSALLFIFFDFFNFIEAWFDKNDNDSDGYDE